MPKKKVLYIATWSDLGGVAIYLLELVKGLKNDIEPYFIMNSEGYLSEELEKLGYKDNIFFVPMTNSIADLKTHFNSNIETLKIIHKIKPDLIHCNSTTAGIIGRLCGFLSKIPVIFTAHGWSFTDGISKKKQLFYKILETTLATLTYKIICVSEYDRQLALKVFPFYKKKLVTIHNGMPDIEKEFIKKNIEEQDELSIIMISRFCPQKDPYTLIEAVDELNKEELNIQLNLYGYGEELEKVKQKIDECNNEKIKYIGSAKPTEITNILYKNDVYALISNWEGLPLGIIEAMRQGLPIIACNVGGNSEAVIDNINGFLIPRNKKDILKTKIREFYLNKSLLKTMSKESRIFYLQKFMSNKMTSNTFAIYKEF